jgi:hypothetical protein
VETAPSAVYEPRNPRASPLYALVEDYFEEFERVYDDRYQQQYGRWRPVIGEVMRKYLECGDLHRGFAHLGCDGCRYQAIFANPCYSALAWENQTTINKIECLQDPRAILVFDTSNLLKRRQRGPDAS